MNECDKNKNHKKGGFVISTQGGRKSTIGLSGKRQQ
jgi:hypothetical protein